jgi:hypothetical protein
MNDATSVTGIDLQNGAGLKFLQSPPGKFLTLPIGLYRGVTAIRKNAFRLMGWSQPMNGSWLSRPPAQLIRQVWGMESCSTGSGSDRAGPLTFQDKSAKPN